MLISEKHYTSPDDIYKLRLTNAVKERWNTGEIISQTRILRHFGSGNVA